MNKYVSLIILKSSLDEQALGVFQKKVEKVINAHQGTIEQYEIIGKRDLASMFDKQHEGIYIRATFTAASQAPKEIADMVRVSEEAIRVLTVRHDSIYQKEAVAS